MKKERVVSYAQNREDVLLAAFFGDLKNGLYVDIGANHPVEDSVTKYFYDRGWRGINVEPNTRLFRLLEQDRPRDINVKKGISDKSGMLTLREYEGWYAGLSTFSKAMQEENKAIEKYRDIEVEVTTLKDLFSQNDVKTIHFMKVDVEGYEYNVLSGNDWSKYRPQVLCVESEHTIKEWGGLLKNANYKKVFFDGLNEYYVADEVSFRADQFNYIESIIGRPIIEYEWDRAITASEHRVEQHKNELGFYKSETARLGYELAEMKKVIPLVKQLAKSIDATIRRRIAELNKVKSEKLKPFSFEENIGEEELLLSIRRYDLEVYYSESGKNDRLLYRVLNYSYSHLSRSVFGIGKKLLLLVRKVRV